MEEDKGCLWCFRVECIPIFPERRFGVERLRPVTPIYGGHTFNDSMTFLIDRRLR